MFTHVWLIFVVDVIQVFLTLDAFLQAKVTMPTLFLTFVCIDTFDGDACIIIVIAIIILFIYLFIFIK